MELAALLHRVRFPDDASPTAALLRRLDDAADEENFTSLRKLALALRMETLKQLGIPVRTFDPGPGPPPHIVVQVDGRTIDPVEGFMSLERYQRCIQRVLDLFAAQVQPGDPIEQLESLLDRNMIAPHAEPAESEKLLVLAQTTLTPFAQHANRMEARCSEWSDNELAASIKDGLTLGDMRRARDLWSRIQDLVNQSRPNFWGVWTEEGQCWAKDGSFLLLFPTEGEAQTAANEWSNREPARRHGYVWLPRVFGEKDSESSFWIVRRVIANGGHEQASPAVACLVDMKPSASNAHERELTAARNDVTAARLVEKHTSDLLADAREHIVAMRTMPPRRYALWNGKRDDWHKDGAGVPYVWDHQGQAHDAHIAFQHTTPEIQHFEVRPYEMHYGAADVSGPSLRTRVEKYWELRCIYYDMWREDFDDLQEAWRWILYAQSLIAQREGACT